MSMIVKTEGIILRTVDVRESSRIITFYTKHYGKIACIAKGARRPRSKFASSLGPLSYVSLVLYKKEGREVQTLSQCDVIKSFRHLYDNLDAMGAGMAMVELVNILTHENEEKNPLFSLLVDSLLALNNATKNHVNMLIYFELHLVEILGFQPSFDHCVSCRKHLKEIADDRNYIFNIERGGLTCSNCSSGSGRGFNLSPETLRILTDFASSHQGERALDIEIPEGSLRTINELLWNYLRFHFHGYHSLKSEKVFTEISSRA